jgi:hypothetical protein
VVVRQQARQPEAQQREQQPAPQPAAQALRRGTRLRTAENLATPPGGSRCRAPCECRRRSGPA